MHYSKQATLVSLLVILQLPVQADIASYSLVSDGDLTVLTSFELPIDETTKFEKRMRTIAKQRIEIDGDMWLTYQEGRERADSNLARYFTVHFPTHIDNLTEPNTAISSLVSAVSRYRTNAELVKQVPSWCTTVSLDPNELPNAFVEYLWVLPGSLDEVAKILSRRGELLRSIYGSSSKGLLASEGFITMIAPYQIMYVLFSRSQDRASTEQLLQSDLEKNGLIREWDKLETQLSRLIIRRQSRSGVFRSELSVDYP